MMMLMIMIPSLSPAVSSCNNILSRSPLCLLLPLLQPFGWIRRSTFSSLHPRANTSINTNTQHHKINPAVSMLLFLAHAHPPVVLLLLPTVIHSPKMLMALLTHAHTLSSPFKSKHFGPGPKNSSLFNRRKMHFPPWKTPEFHRTELATGRFYTETFDSMTKDSILHNF